MILDDMPEDAAEITVGASRDVGARVEVRQQPEPRFPGPVV
ncbi:hypothetical protein ACIRU3_16555 [Streptomyces sp. NPDC101151]